MDAHCGLVEPALMDLLEEIVPRLPALRAIMFEIMPDYIESVGLSPIAAMLGRLNDVWNRRRKLTAAPMSRRTSAPTEHIGPDQAPSAQITSATWESAIGAAVVGI